MRKLKIAWEVIVQISVVAGGLVAVMAYLEIKPKNLPQVSAAHWMWLAFAALLFGLSLSLSLTAFPRMKRLEQTQSLFGRSGGLNTRAGEAEALVRELERVQERFKGANKTLMRPLVAISDNDLKDGNFRELYRFQAIYQWHLASVKRLDETFKSEALEKGCPSTLTSDEVLRMLSDHGALLRQYARDVADGSRSFIDPQSQSPH
jgi:hypothetical protein